MVASTEAPSTHAATWSAELLQQEETDRKKIEKTTTIITDIFKGLFDLKKAKVMLAEAKPLTTEELQAKVTFQKETRLYYEMYFNMKLHQKKEAMERCYIQKEEEKEKYQMEFRFDLKEEDIQEEARLDTYEERHLKEYWDWKQRQIEASSIEPRC